MPVVYQLALICIISSSMPGQVLCCQSPSLWSGHVQLPHQLPMPKKPVPDLTHALVTPMPHARGMWATLLLGSSGCSRARG